MANSTPRPTPEPSPAPAATSRPLKTRDNEGLEPHEEPDSPVTLTSDAIAEASLFDQFADASDPDSPETVEPQTNADESAVFDEHRGPAGTDEEAREAEQQRMRAALRQNPDRRAPASERENWEANRRSGGTGSNQ